MACFSPSLSTHLACSRHSMSGCISFCLRQIALSLSSCLGSLSSLLQSVFSAPSHSPTLHPEQPFEPSTPALLCPQKAGDEHSVLLAQQVALGGHLRCVGGQPVEVWAASTACRWLALDSGSSLLLGTPTCLLSGVPRCHCQPLCGRNQPPEQPGKHLVHRPGAKS